MFSVRPLLKDRYGPPSVPWAISVSEREASWEWAFPLEHEVNSSPSCLPSLVCEITDTGTGSAPSGQARAQNKAGAP